MARLILTFETMFQVLAADKLLRTEFLCRPVPTPAGLSSDICGISLELLEPETREIALDRLNALNHIPKGVFCIE